MTTSTSTRSVGVRRLVHCSNIAEVNLVQPFDCHPTFCHNKERLMFPLQIKDIKDDVEYYIENCREPDFMDNDMLYDDIDGLEEMLLEVNVREYLFQCLSDNMSLNMTGLESPNTT